MEPLKVAAEAGQRRSCSLLRRALRSAPAVPSQGTFTPFLRGSSISSKRTATHHGSQQDAAYPMAVTFSPMWGARLPPEVMRFAISNLMRNMPVLTVPREGESTVDPSHDRSVQFWVQCFASHTPTVRAGRLCTVRLIAVWCVNILARSAKRPIEEPAVASATRALFRLSLFRNFQQLRHGPAASLTAVALGAEN